VVAVWLDDTIPGGQALLQARSAPRRGRGVGRREDHRQAAARELQEEVGVLIDCDALRLVVVAPTALALDYPYEARLTAKPELMVEASQATCRWQRSRKNHKCATALLLV
jgi:8-oxo-dGTP pyrophosphatase MutT (NUDIX family)